MPNYAENLVVITGQKERVKDLFQKIEEKGLLNTLVPRPFLENDDWYFKNWGTDRNVRDTDYLYFEYEDGTALINCYFRSAFNVPTNCYKIFLSKNSDISIEGVGLEVGDNWGVSFFDGNEYEFNIDSIDEYLKSKEGESTPDFIKDYIHEKIEDYLKYGTRF